MSKKQLYDNYRVEVYTPRPHLVNVSDHKRMLAETRDLEKDIKRHIDHEGTDIKVDDVSECEFCGAWWTEESSEYNGGCCDQDQAAAA